MLSLSLNIDTIIILGDLNVNEVKYVKERNSKERSMISVLRIALHGIKVNNLDPDSIFVSRLFCCITLLSFQNTITFEINECSEDVKVNWQHYAQYKFGAKYHYMHCYCHDFTNLEIIFAGTPQYCMFTTCTDQYRAFRTVSELQETSQYIYSPPLQTWQVLHLAMKFVQPLLIKEIL